MAYSGKTPEERFWIKVDKKGLDDCWNWLGGLQSKGYGAFRIDWRRQGSAHKIAWEFINGAVPTGSLVLHKCDNKLCVNPNHLYIGSQKDNMRDRAERQPVHPMLLGAGKAKLSSADVTAIRNIKNKSQDEIAKTFGVSQGTISHVLRSAYLSSDGMYI